MGFRSQARSAKLMALSQTVLTVIGTVMAAFTAKYYGAVYPIVAAAALALVLTGAGRSAVLAAAGAQVAAMVVLFILIGFNILVLIEVQDGTLDFSPTLIDNSYSSTGAQAIMFAGLCVYSTLIITHTFACHIYFKYFLALGKRRA